MLLDFKKGGKVGYFVLVRLILIRQTIELCLYSAFFDLRVDKKREMLNEEKEDL
jgi:hypothetical protein